MTSLMKQILLENKLASKLRRRPWEGGIGGTQGGESSIFISDELFDPKSLLFLIIYVVHWFLYSIFNYMQHLCADLVFAT